jgi:hypothetical protein
LIEKLVNDESAKNLPLNDLKIVTEAKEIIKEDFVAINSLMVDEGSNDSCSNLCDSSCLCICGSECSCPCEHLNGNISCELNLSHKSSFCIADPLVCTCPCKHKNVEVKSFDERNRKSF